MGLFSHRQTRSVRHLKRKNAQQSIWARARAQGSPFSIEDLEQRQMLSFDAHVNFQPAGKPAPAGYVADSGQTYGARANGATYGWTTAGVTVADRWANSDYRKDSLAAMQYGGNYTWEMAVPNGTYKVTIGMGDGNGWNQLQKVNAENVTVVNGTTTMSNRWLEGTATVVVADGKLTLSSPSALSSNALDYMDVVSVDGTTTGDTGTTTGGTGTTTGGTGTTTGGTGTTTGGTDTSGGTTTGGTTTGGTTSGTTSLKVNFQPTTMKAPTGYLADSGKVFGDRGNGNSYGWNKDGSLVTDRWTTADDLHDSLAAMQYGGTYTWEAAVANGTYTVKIVAGDANGWNHLQKITAEGVVAVNGTPTMSQRWAEGTATVTVTDGRLTIASAAGTDQNVINYVEITPAAAGATVGSGATILTSGTGVSSGTTTPPPTDTGTGTGTGGTTTTPPQWTDIPRGKPSIR